MDSLAVLVEHDWIDAVNASSTIVIALFTVAMFFVVKYQLRASKDIERAWVMLTLGRDPLNSLFLCENTSKSGASITSVTTTGFFQLMLQNDGNGPVWVKQLQARMILVDSTDELPNKPSLNKQDDQDWYPAPFVETDSVRFTLTTNGSRVSKNLVVAYGKVIYLDKFRETNSPCSLTVRLASRIHDSLSSATAELHRRLPEFLPQKRGL